MVTPAFFCRSTYFLLLSLFFTEFNSDWLPHACCFNTGWNKFIKYLAFIHYVAVINKLFWQRINTAVNSTVTECPVLLIQFQLNSNIFSSNQLVAVQIFGEIKFKCAAFLSVLANREQLLIVQISNKNTLSSSNANIPWQVRRVNHIPLPRTTVSISRNTQCFV